MYKPRPQALPLSLRPTPHRTQVRIVVSELATAYAAEPAPLPETSSQPPAQRHRRLIFELNRTGQYGALQDSLKAPLLRLVKDR